MRVGLRTCFLAIALGLIATRSNHDGQHQSVSIISSSAKALAKNRLSLLENLDPAMAQRVRQLIRLKYDKCSAKALENGKLLAQLGEIPVGVGIEDDPPNCYVALWNVLTGKTIPSMNAEIYITPKLKQLGYHLEAEIVPFRIGMGFIDALDFKRLDKVLKPGDVLLFYGHEVFTNIKHAALYLGQLAGQHYIFQKPNIFCGAFSPYEIETLDSLLGEWIGQQLRRSLMQKVLVYRK